MPTPDTRDLWRDIVAGLAVFLSMSYVAFANPIILQGAGMPWAPVFFATCFIAALASFASGAYARSPAALAPGLALSAVVTEFLQFEQTTIGWESALVVCAIAGVILLWMSLSGFRRQVIDSIPPTIKLAVIGGIGAVLADKAKDLVVGHPGDQNLNLLAFFTGLAVLVLGYMVLRSLALRVENPSAKRALDLLGRSSFFVSVILVALIVYLFGTPSAESVSGANLFLWSHSSVSLGEAITGALKWESLSLLFFIIYILVADIVGSPYHLALDDAHFRTERFGDEEERRIRRSFVVDSVSNVAAPIVGTSPVVYYAENFAGKVLGGRSPLVAYVSGLGFLGLFVFGLYLWQSGQSIALLIPGIAVAPVLFFVGLIIISKALWPTAGDQSVSGQERSATVEEGQVAADFVQLGSRLPAAIAIVATPAAGFEIGIAAGILSYFLFHHITPYALREHEGKEGALNWLALMALVSVVIKMKLAFGF